MASHRSLLSDAAKMRIAEEMGVADRVAAEGWGAVSSRQCGGVVAVAIRIAEQALASGQRPPAAAPGQTAARQPVPAGMARAPEAFRHDGFGGW